MDSRVTRQPEGEDGTHSDFATPNITHTDMTDTVMQLSVW